MSFVDEDYAYLFTNNNYLRNIEEEIDQNDGCTDLHIAVKRNRLWEVKNLLEKKVSLNIQNNDGLTSLLLSCLLPDNDTNITKLLIQSGADINISNKYNCTPLLACCRMQKTALAELLLSLGANVNDQDNFDYTALHYAIENDDLYLVNLLLHSGADTNIVNYNGWNALMMALHEHDSCAEMILPFTEDLNASASNGWTALMHAASSADKNIVLKLVELGADVNINVDGNMPVTLALERSDPTVFNYLWDITDTELIKMEDEFHSFIGAMITTEWIKPQKVEYFYKVLDTPEVTLSSGGFVKMLANFHSDEEFLSIDVCAIIEKMFEKGAHIIDLDIEGFISMCYRYTASYKHKLLNILIENNANFNCSHYMYLSVIDDPEFTVLLLHYCINYNPIDILKCIIKVKRLDIPMLKLIKNILRLCTPWAKLREDCIKNIKSFDILNADCVCYAILIESLEFPRKKYIRHDFTPEEKEVLPKLYNEVIDILEQDRLPTLKELCRDKVRQCMATHCLTTNDYLESLEQLTVPKIIKDIIQCKTIVCSVE